MKRTLSRQTKTKILGWGLLALTSPAMFWLSGHGINTVMPPWSRGRPMLFWIIELERADNDTEIQAIEALSEFGPRAALAVPALSRALDSEDEWTRLAAIRALCKIGPNATQAIPALVRSLKSHQPLTPPFSGGGMTHYDQTPFEARETLVCIGTAAVPALTDALQSRDALTRVNAAWALWKIQSKSQSSLTVLTAAFHEVDHDREDVCIRRVTADALGDIGRQEPERILPILLAGLREGQYTGYHAICALRVMAPKEPRALKLLCDRSRRDK